MTPSDQYDNTRTNSHNFATSRHQYEVAKLNEMEPSVQKIEEIGDAETNTGEPGHMIELTDLQGTDHDDQDNS